MGKVSSPGTRATWAVFHGLPARLGLPTSLLKGLEIYRLISSYSHQAGVHHDPLSICPSPVAKVGRLAK